MRNKFDYCCSIKICASRYNELLESIFSILLAVEAFSLQKVVEMLEQVVVGWVNMAGEAKLHSPILSSFEVLIVWPAVRCCCAEQLGPFCWLVQATGVAIFGASHLFAEHTSQMLWFHWDSESYKGSDGQQTTKQWPWPFFWCKFGFTKCFGASSQFNHWASHHRLHKIHFSAHITIRLRNSSLLLHTIREDDTSKRWFIWFSVSSWGTHLSSFFTFPIFFKCWATVEWLTLSSLASSWAAVRKSASTILSIGHWQLLTAGPCTPHLQGSRLLYKTSWTTTVLYAC